MAIVSMDSITEFGDADNDFVLIGSQTDKKIKKMAINDFLTNVNADGSTSGGTTSIPFTLTFDSGDSYKLDTPVNELVEIKESFIADKTPFCIDSGLTWCIICDEDDLESYFSYFDDNHVSVIINFEYKDTVDWDTVAPTGGQRFQLWYSYSGGNPFKVSFPVAIWIENGRIPVISGGAVTDYKEAPIIMCSGNMFGDDATLWITSRSGIVALVKAMNQ